MAILLKAARLSSSSFHYAINHVYKKADPTIVELIKDIVMAFKDYGYRRVVLALRNKGIKINHKKVQRIMQEYNLQCTAYDKQTRKYNSYKGHVGTVAKHKLKRRFITDRPFQKIVTDVTEVRWGSQSMQERAYVTAYLDLYSGTVLSWNIGLSPSVKFVIDPLDELIKNRPSLPYRMTVHSDQGLQYQHHQFVTTLSKNRIIQSMSRKATCLDNAVIESFFRTLKVCTVHQEQYQTFADLKSAVIEFMNYYNNKRIKEKLDGMSPVEFQNHAIQLIA
ncbi:IS3 family transposase [Periweissella ghanensis]|uniref:IS3 family transposase ISWco1 n=1 Tax=Periweissella ghanensis TaxID=467997 RepID=A0ABN8BTG1_9LACO|nr:IS3 family transposase [Periweissella ghanensis]CAH0419517.1 IS3 family transposase ISWco1 [Periweissella ghanensis]